MAMDDERRNELLEKLRERVQEDPSFRTGLMENPQQTLEEAGLAGELIEVRKRNGC